VQFSFDSYSTAEIKDDVLAYGVVHGSFPELIVIDTLLNIAGTGDDEQRPHGPGDGGVPRPGAADRRARAGAAPRDRQYDDGDKPVPLGGLVNKLSKLPAQILTLYARDGDVFACPVKNRQGKADPSASMQVRLRFDKERMRFTDGS
jgi:hypothetical protein